VELIAFDKNVEIIKRFGCSETNLALELKMHGNVKEKSEQGLNSVFFYECNT